MGKPKIRFKGYTEDWEQRKLGDVAQEFKSGNSLKADKIDITGDYPVYGGNGLRGYTSTYNHDGEYALIGRQGALCGNMNYSVGKAYFTEHAVVVKADANNDTRFLYYMLDTMNLGQYSDQSAQPGLAVNKLVKLENRFPIKEEQQRIGWYFSNLDHLITLHQRKCDETKKLKKCMLQKMFPKEGEKVPEIRFSGFTGDWKQRKLNEVCKINGRIGFRGYTQKDIVSQEQGGVLTFSPTNIVDNTLTMKCRNTYITKEKYEESPEIKIKNGDILFVKTGSTLGKSALVMGLHENATINPQIVVLRTQEEEAKFLSVILISDSLLKKVAAVKIGGAVPTITEAELKNFTFYEPEDFAERVKIGNCFTYFDPIITFHHRKLNILNKICRYAWEQRKLDDVAEFSKGSGYSKGDLIESGTPIILYGRLYTKYETIISDVDTFVEAKDGSVYSKGGEVIVPASGETAEDIARAASIDKSGILLGGDLNVVMPNEDINSAFLAISISNGSSQRELARKAQGKSVVHIHNEEIRNLIVPFPTRAEQNKIENYFADLDNLITLHQQKCKQLQIIRKYMLKNMFL